MVYHVYLRHSTSVCWHILKNPAWVWTSCSRSDNNCRT